MRRAPTGWSTVACSAWRSDASRWARKASNHGLSGVAIDLISAAPSDADERFPGATASASPSYVEMSCVRWRSATSAGTGRMSCPWTKRIENLRSRYGSPTVCTCTPGSSTSPNGRKRSTRLSPDLAASASASVVERIMMTARGSWVSTTSSSLREGGIGRVDE